MGALIGCCIFGFFLILLGIFFLKSRKKGLAVFELIAGGLFFVAGIFAIALSARQPKSEKVAEEMKVQKEVARLTLQDFSTFYSQFAPLFGAQSGFVLNIEPGENADIAKAKINDISNIDVAVEKSSEKKILGVMIFVGSSNDSVRMWEALTVTYAIVKIFEPERPTESIPEFVEKLLNMGSGSSTNSGNVIYTVNQALGNTILSIRYPTE